jgi:hypothetical protein
MALYIINLLLLVLAYCDSLDFFVRSQSNSLIQSKFGMMTIFWMYVIEKVNHLSTRATLSSRLHLLTTHPPSLFCNFFAFPQRRRSSRLMSKNTSSFCIFVTPLHLLHIVSFARSYKYYLLDCRCKPCDQERWKQVGEARKIFYMEMGNSRTRQNCQHFTDT